MNLNMNWIQQSAAKLDADARNRALARQGSLTKPAGSLGQLEEIAVWLAERQANEFPVVNKVWISVFAADHGVMAEQVSAFPQVVTGEMIKNFAAGGAAICVLANALDARLEVINLGVVNEPGELPGIVQDQIAPQTHNIANGPAMTSEQFLQALSSGKRAAERAQAQHSNLYIAGDMGIGNTTVSAAMASAYLKMDPEQLVGPGTGLDTEGVQHKAAVVKQALACNQANCATPAGILQSLGGFEIAAITAAMIRAAQLGLPILVDGYIASTAALAAVRINASIQDWLYFSHRSAEPGHAAILKALKAKSVLNLGMRLGEASGAAVAVPLFSLACELHNNMATFDEAGVSEG
jgi:nicotinate-nucleotide--dimethylbenzimidazole phosphoribosyltransferase